MQLRGTIHSCVGPREVPSSHSFGDVTWMVGGLGGNGRVQVGENKSSRKNDYRENRRGAKLEKNMTC